MRNAQRSGVEHNAAARASTVEARLNELFEVQQLPLREGAHLVVMTRYFRTMCND